MKYPIRGRFAIRVSLICLSLVILLTFSQESASAQNVNAGEIRGTVSDGTGAVMPDVKVELLNTQTGVKREVVTNASGVYDALSLVPGNYSVTFSKEGFSRLVRSSIDLRVEVITIDAQLSVGATTQQVEVSANTVLLRTENSEQGVTFQAETMKELPNIGQTWLNFTNTLPGVALAGGARDGQAVSVNGNQRYQGNFLADGGLAILPRSNNLDSTVIFESIAEVKVVTASFDAQYGSGTAVFNQITKSGTNAFHGAVYDYAQHDMFNARNFFSLSDKAPHSRRHQYGASIGGPVLRDKLFFYFNWDSVLSRTATDTFLTYPTAAMRSGDFSDPAFPRIYDPASLATVNGQQVRQQFPGNRIPQASLDPVALNIQKYLPMPNRPGFVNNFYYQRMAKTHPNVFLGKADYNISSSNRLSFSLMRRFAITEPDVTTSITYPMDANRGYGRGLQGQLTDVWTFGTSVVNEFRFAVVRQLSRNTPSSLDQGFPKQLGINYAIADVFPNITIGGPVGSTSIASGTSSVIAQTSYVPSNITTIVRGRHILKAGGQWEANSDNGGNFGDLISAALTFNPVFTASAPFGTGGLGYADFLTGQVSVWNALISPVIGLRMKTGQMFFQDDIKLRRNLTINLGFRYEIQGGWSEVSDRLTVFDPEIPNPAAQTLGGMWWGGDNGRRRLQETKHSILPRAGFAWAPKEKWSLRGGFGVFSHRWGTDIYANPAARVAAYYINGTMTQTDAINPVFKASDPNPKLNLFIPDPSKRTPDSLNGQPVFYYPYDSPVAKVYEWSFAIQREMTAGLVGEVAYVGTRGTNLGWTRDFNQVPVNLLGPGNAQPRRPYPQFQAITANLFDNGSNYHGLQATLRKQFSRGLTFNVNYTWSKNLVYQDSAGWSGDASSGTAEYQNARDRNANYGLSNNDMPHMFKAFAVYQLPFGKGQAMMNSSGLLDALFGGWQSSAIFIRHSGTPFNPVMGTANRSGALSGNWYPNRIRDGKLDNPTINQWFDTSAFVEPAPFTFGNSGRNVLRGPNWQTLDFSMGKNIRMAALREGMELQIRMDAMNILNHAVFANPNSRIGAAGVGTITSTFVPARTIQLGARLAF